jgi:hypothetical protein
MSKKIQSENLERSFRELRSYRPAGWIGPAGYGFVRTPKPQNQVKRRELVSKRGKSTWQKGSHQIEDVASGDLLAMMHEDTDKQLAPSRMPGQNDFKNAEKRTGQALTSNAFIQMVTKLNPNLICEDSLNSKNCAAFYELRYNPATGKMQKRYTAACFRKGYIPEFTIVKADAADMVSSDGITYGWRTVLQRLIQQKVLRFRDAMTVFGEVHHQDLRGKNWALAVAAFR